MRSLVSDSSPAGPMMIPSRRMRSPCCARTLSGHTAAEPAMALMKSRRLIAYPENEQWYRQTLVPWKGSRNVRFGSKADIAARPVDVRFTPKSRHCGARLACPLRAKSGHTLKLADCGHNKLWRECQIALLRYGPLYNGKDCFNIGMIDRPAAPGVFRHVLNHRQQPAIRIGTRDYLNAYVGQTGSSHLA